MANFFTEHWIVISFYVLVAILLYTFRRKFEFQGIVALLKTKFGLKFMTETGKRWPRFWHHLGLVSIILCFAGMLFITGYLFVGLYNLVFVPDAPPTLSPVIPGVSIPGSPIDFPLGYTIIALFFAVIVHEAAHGIWSAAYKIKIKSSGFAFFGPLPGAFVEPEEKQLVKRSRREQLAIFAAGPFANVVLAVFVLFLMAGVNIMASPLATDGGVRIESVADGMPAALAGIPEDSVITAVGGKEVANFTDFADTLHTYKPGEKVTITADGTLYSVVLAAQPDNESVPRLGVDVKPAVKAKEPSQQWLLSALIVLLDVLWWTYLLSFSLGIANLLPIGPIDGGRMLLTVLTVFFPEKQAKLIWSRTFIVLLVLVVILVLVPIVRAII